MALHVNTYVDRREAFLAVGHYLLAKYGARAVTSNNTNACNTVTVGEATSLSKVFTN